MATTDDNGCVKNFCELPNSGNQIYYCYLIIADNLTYIGITNNIVNRLIKHNSGLGSKFTRRKNNWQYNTIVGTFDKAHALKFEWYWKHYKTPISHKWSRTKSGLSNKIKRLDILLAEPMWSNVKII